MVLVLALKVVTKVKANTKQIHDFDSLQLDMKQTNAVVDMGKQASVRWQHICYIVIFVFAIYIFKSK